MRSRASSPVRPSRPADGRREPIRIMLVDDHSFFRRGLRQMLRALGLDVVAEAGTGEWGLEIVSRVAPDVVMMDLNMPGMDGIEATRQLAARAPGARA